MVAVIVGHYVSVYLRSAPVKSFRPVEKDRPLDRILSPCVSGHCWSDNLLFYYIHFLLEMYMVLIVILLVQKKDMLYLK